MTSGPLPEPWLRGPIHGVDPVLAAVLNALVQAREDLEKHTQGISDPAIWSRPCGLAPLGFQLRHIAGSLDRLTTYLQGGDLSASQFAFLHSEMDCRDGREALLDGVVQAINRASDAVRSLEVNSLREPRTVGRSRLPTTVIGLAVHLAEHTQRHVGQSIVLCNLLKAHAAEADRAACPVR
jgi:hypothetical protein